MLKVGPNCKLNYQDKTSITSWNDFTVTYRDCNVWVQQFVVDWQYTTGDYSGGSQYSLGTIIHKVKKDSCNINSVSYKNGTAIGHDFSYFPEEELERRIDAIIGRWFNMESGYVDYRSKNYKEMSVEETEKLKRLIPWMYDMITGKPFLRPICDMHNLCCENPTYKKYPVGHKDFWTNKLPPTVKEKI